MTYKELEDLFWQAAADILEPYIENPDKYVRMRYPKDGLPDWTWDDNVLFLTLNEREDDYAHQRDSTYHTENGTVYRRTTRTRVWELACTAYGPDAYEMLNRLKDGFFFEQIKEALGKQNVFLIPNIPTARQASELFAGHWWNRWDIEFYFNEGYQLADEDVGHIDSIPLSVGANRP